MNKPTQSKEKLNDILKGKVTLPKLTLFNHLTKEESLEYSILLESVRNLLPHQQSNEQLERRVYFILKTRGEKVSYPLSEEDRKRVEQILIQKSHETEQQ